jgi:hypothetical protein
MADYRAEMSAAPSERTDDEVIRDCIESMKAGCGCIPHNRPPCDDKRCPNSPKWAGLIQFDAAFKLNPPVR